MRATPLFLALGVTGGLAACGPNGTGRAQVDFTEPNVTCPPQSDGSAFEDFAWDAGYLATNRFYEVLRVDVQEFNVDIFETDSVSFQVDLEGLEQAGLLARDGDFYRPAQPPLTVPVGPGRAEAQLLVGLYRTCERFPGFRAVGGEIVLDVFRIRVDGSDTGDGERVAGRVLSSSISYARAPAPVGTVAASFDFEPPRRPLREFE